MTSTEIDRIPWKLLDCKLRRIDDNIKEPLRDEKISF